MISHSIRFRDKARAFLALQAGLNCLCELCGEKPADYAWASDYCADCKYELYTDRRGEECSST